MSGHIVKVQHSGSASRGTITAPVFDTFVILYSKYLSARAQGTFKIRIYIFI